MHTTLHSHHNPFNVRFHLLSTTEGKAFNWIFLPGGPGLDSEYLKTLTDTLNLPGNVWLMDLPNNGSNAQPDSNFDEWDKIFIDSIKSFQNVVLVGHSFGGMYALLFPELEKILSGVIILNSSPSLWLIEAARVAKERNLPSIDAELTEMQLNPSTETAKIALMACAPYYFKKDDVEKGKEFLGNLSFNHHAANWWFQRIGKTGFNATWIPQNIPALIIGSEYDSITPFVLFENDSRFHRNNIVMKFIKDAGHLPWLEKPTEVKNAIEKFSRDLK